MATPVEAPKLGNSVEECIVTRWAKKKGDTVSAGELVVDIETDKATFELTAPVGGTILETFFDEGALVPVFTNLFVIGEPGEDITSFRPQNAPSQEIAKPAAAPEPAPVVTQTGAKANGKLSPRARRFAEERKFNPSSVAGSGPGGRVL
jgi:pyruvate dehydrogenase E2 component (dihydrolipoamide acetyltransferase)